METKPNSAKVDNVETTQVHTMENCPIAILEKNETFQIIIGNNIVSDKVFRNLEDAKKYVSKKPWEILTALMCFIVESFNNYQNEQEQFQAIRKENEKNN